jgi:hypothetical protein
VASQSEMRHDGPIGGEETLGLAWRFKPLHAPFPLAGGLTGVFGDNHPWDVLASFEELPEELLGCRFIPSALHQDLEHVTVLLHRPKEPIASVNDGARVGARAGRELEEQCAIFSEYIADFPVPHGPVPGFATRIMSDRSISCSRGPSLVDHACNRPLERSSSPEAVAS